MDTAARWVVDCGGCGTFQEGGIEGVYGEHERMDESLKPECQMKEKASINGSCLLFCGVMEGVA